MLDRLFYRGQWFDLPNQRPLDECFWQHQRCKKLLVGHPAHPLRDDEYACNWKVEGQKLWLLSISLDEDGSELVPRLLPGEQPPVLARWQTGILDANAELTVETGKTTIEEHGEIPIVRFHVEEGRVVLTEHLRISPQLGWNEDETSLRVTDWKQGA